MTGRVVFALAAVVLSACGAPSETSPAAHGESAPRSAGVSPHPATAQAPPGSGADRSKRTPSANGGPRQPGFREGSSAPRTRVYRASDPPPKHDDRRLEELGIRKYTSQRLHLYSDLDPGKVRELPDLVDRIYDAWVDYFGPLPPDREGTGFVITGYLIGDKALFRETGLLPEDLPPFPHGRNKGTRFWMNDQPTDYYRRHLLLHEATHCFMTAVENPLMPQVWYMEGMAELFGTHRFDAAGVPHFRVLPDDREQFANLGRIRLIEDEIRARPPRELTAVMGLTPAEYLSNAAYAWSWGLCSFLDGHPRYRERFRSAGRAVTTGESTGDWERLFASDRADLEEEWLLYAANLCHGYDRERAAIEFRAGKPLSPGGTTETQVAADRGWQSSGVEVEEGQTYSITAGGRFIIAHAPQAGGPAVPSASEREPPKRPWESEPQGISIQYHAGRPLGMLMGTIRAPARPDRPPRTTMLDVIPFGREATFTAPVTGTLYLRLNDDWNSLADNAGNADVVIRRP